MAIPDKQILLSEVERSLRDKLTTKDSETVERCLLSILVAYNVERKTDPEHCTDFEEYLKVFIDAKRVEGCSEGTIYQYNYKVHKLMEKTTAPVSEVTVFHIRRFLMDEKERGIKETTLKGYRAAFSAFFKWLFDESLIRTNPCSNLSRIKCKEEVRLPLTAADIELLKEACETKRDKALITFLLSTGCRISEVCALNKGAVDFQKQECKVLGKGNKERIVYLDQVSTLQLRSYLSDRKDNNPALFVGKGDKRLLPGGVRKRLNELGAKAGVDNVHPHRFRRTLATSLIERGMSIQMVARILGHSSINTTMRYVYIKDLDVLNDYRRRVG